MRVILLVTAAAVSTTGCDKVAEFFSSQSGSGLFDRTPPMFLDFLPAQSLGGPYNGTSLTFRTVDPAGSVVGEPVSGVKYSSLSVLSGGTPVPYTISGDVVTVNLTGVANGPFTLSGSVTDNADNAQTFDYTGYKKFGLSPTITFTQTPAATIQSSNPSESFTWTGSISDPFLATAFGAIYWAGADGQCGTPDDQVPEVGTGPGQVSQQMWTYVGSSFNVTSVFRNPVAAGGQPITWRTCFRATANDLARNAAGDLFPNTRTSYALTDIQWSAQPPSPPQFTVTVTSCHRHVGPGNSYIAWVITFSSSAAVGKPYSFTATGPGIVGTATYSGTVPANGIVVLQTNINLFGNYTLSGQVDGVPVTDTHAVDGSSDPNC